MRSEVGPNSDPVRSSQFNNFNYAVNFTNFIGRTEWKYGIFARAPSLTTELGGLFQEEEIGIGRRHKIGMYLEPDIHFNANLRARVGLIAMLFTGNTNNTFFEPRARVVWEKGAHEVSLALGIYHQEVIGLNDRRDATNVFTAWVNAPSDELTQSKHALIGYRLRPTDWLEFSTEAYYKSIDNVFIAEWTAFPRFTTRMQPASGRALGWDLRAELRRPNFYAFLNYGLASVEYDALQSSLQLWYGDDSVRFRPPHDRRHQINVVASTSIYTFDISTRWNFGSGLPFSEIVGFDGFALLDGVQNIFDIDDSRRVIYDRPFGGVLPAYHRLDISIDRKFRWDSFSLTAQAGVINVYNRRNILSFDVFTFRRSDQLPIIPTVGLKIEFE